MRNINNLRVIHVFRFCFYLHYLLNQYINYCSVVIRNDLMAAFHLSCRKIFFFICNSAPNFNGLLLCTFILIKLKNMKSQNSDLFNERKRVLIKIVNHLWDTLQSCHSNFWVILVLSTLENLIHYDDSIPIFKDSFCCWDDVQDTFDTSLSDFIVYPRIS